MKIPTEPFYAVTFESSQTIPGDERSRTHPGHGYPEHTVSTQELKIFKDQDEFKNWILDEANKGYGKRSYTALHCKPFTVTLDVQVNLPPNM